MPRAASAPSLRRGAIRCIQVLASTCSVCIRCSQLPVAGDGLGRWRVGDQATLIEQQHAIEILDQRQVMADDDDVFRQAGDSLLHQRPVPEVELIGRFIKDEDVRPGDQHGAESSHLQFAAGKLMRPPFRQVADTEPVENAIHRRLDLGLPRPRALRPKAMSSRMIGRMIWFCGDWKM